MILKKKNRGKGFILPDFKTHYKLIVIKILYYWHRDQWHRIETPETKPYIYGQFIFDQSAKAIRWGKRQSSQVVPQDSWPSTHKEMKLDYYLTQRTKVNLKWITDIDVRAKNIKL